MSAVGWSRWFSPRGSAPRGPSFSAHPEALLLGLDPQMWLVCAHGGEVAGVDPSEHLGLQEPPAQSSPHRWVTCPGCVAPETTRPAGQARRLLGSTRSEGAEGGWAATGQDGRRDCPRAGRCWGPGAEGTWRVGASCQPGGALGPALALLGVSLRRL